MGYALIRYGVKNTSLEENRALIAKVFEDLHQSAPKAVQYAVLELDGGEFVHIVRTPDDGDASPLTQLPAFKAFGDSHAERRSTPVMRSPARIIGNYRLLGEAKPGS